MTRYCPDRPIRYDLKHAAGLMPQVRKDDRLNGARIFICGKQVFLECV
jgi:hypothetical protein